MSEQIATVTQDYIVKRHKECVDGLPSHCIAKRSAKKWMIAARYIIEDGLNVTAFLKQSGVTRNFYYDTKRFLETADDYEAIRSQSALDAATDYEIGVDLERKYTEKMFEAMDSGEMEIDAKGYAQIQRGQSMKNDRFNKLSGATTQHIVVEHKTTLGEAEEFARKALEGIQEVEIVED
jgi:hypothetical protein